MMAMLLRRAALVGALSSRTLRLRCLQARYIQPCITSNSHRNLFTTVSRFSGSSVSPSVLTHSSRRTKLHETVEKMKEMLPDSFQLEVVGDFRRGAEDVNEGRILVVDLEDGREPSFPSDGPLYEEEIKGIASQLVYQGFLVKSSDAEGRKYALSSDPTLSIELYYVPRACHGAARLYLTGDDSYIRFLKLMAMDAYGLTFNEYGLWRPDKPTIAAGRKGKKQVSSWNSLPSGLSIESIDKPVESEGQRKMRETRKEMGLPEGLDLSLDLGPPKKSDRLEEEILSKTEEHHHKQILIKIAGKGGEADVLDVLGLVWIPPSMRTVKEPE